jgi:hypothetical protein
MKEERIKANGDICDYCKYYYISDKILQARMCCACCPTIDNFSGIECTRLTKEEE